MIVTLSFEGPLFRLRPLWAFAAGLLASGGSLPLLHILLLLFLVEGVMPAWWHSLLTLSGPDFPPLPSTGKKFTFPYAVPGSLAWRTTEALGKLAAWWEKDFWPERGKAFSSLLAFTFLALSLSHRAGLWPVLALAGALGLAGVMCGRRGMSISIWRAFYSITVPWLAGYTAVRIPGALPLLSAFLFGFAAWVLENGPEGWKSWPLLGSLGLLFLTFWFGGQHLLAGGLACLMLSLPGAKGERRHHLLLLALLLNALALRQSIR